MTSYYFVDETEEQGPVQGKEKTNELVNIKSIFIRTKLFACTEIA